jgi:hypothetical protein
MSSRGFDHSPRGYSYSPAGYCNVSKGYSPSKVPNRRQNLPGNNRDPPAWGSPVPGQWTPTYPNRRLSVSPRHHQCSLRMQVLSSSFTPSEYRKSNPREYHFRTPDSSFLPYSSPHSGGYRGRESGKKNYKTYQVISFNMLKFSTICISR